MENIDKKSALKALVEKGKAVGKLTTQEIDNAILDLDIVRDSEYNMYN